VLDALIRRLAWPVPRDRAWAAALALFIIANLFYHGAQPGTVGALAAPWNTAAHLLLFFLLGTLAWIAFAGRRFWAVLIVCALVGGTDELAQLIEPGRAVDWLDWLADVAGLLLAGALLARTRRRLRSAAAVR